MSKAIAYVRVSTQQQGKSGLGLEAQLAAIHSYAASTGVEIVGIYEEIESGKANDRPQLAKALAHARKIKAALIVAKLDRLARNVAFVSSIMESGVEFIAVDNPAANRLTLHILAAVAEHEAEAISSRTKAALKAAKARGVKLGSPVAAQTVAAARAANSAKARAKASNTLAIVKEIETSGITSLAGIARVLTARGVLTPKGRSSWQAAQVLQLKRIAA